jgi:hypothetical protein
MPKLMAIKRPGGFLPLLLSLAALGVVLLRLSLAGSASEMHDSHPDEGLVAHLWQLLMVAQVPIIAVFAVRGLRRDPAGTLPVVGLQLLAILAAAVPVFLLRW